MKSALAFLLVLACAASANAQGPIRGRARVITSAAEVSESFSHTAKLGRGGTVELENVAGDVTVTGGGGNDVRIEAVKRARAPFAQPLRTFLQELAIDVIERGGNVEIRTQRPRRTGALTSVDFTVTVPNGANLLLRTGSGNVTIRNVSGEVRAESTSGDVVANSVKRVRELRSVSGNVELSDCEADEFDVNTLSGEVVIRNLKGRVLDLQTITGNARLMNVTSERASLRSMSGDLDFAGRLAKSGRYEFQTHGGNIRVAPSGSPGFDLEASTLVGDLRSDFVLKIIEQLRGGRAPRAVPRERSLRGTVGDGAAVLTATSFSGNIRIVKPE